MRILYILCLTIVIISPSSSQKQLDSIYYLILENNNWTNNFRRTYTYGQNTKAETTSSYFTNLQKFVPSNYYLYTYSPTCNNYLIQRDNHTYTNGVLEKNISIYYDRNNQCHLEKQRTIRSDNVTTLSHDYLNLDAQGNAGHIKYYRFDPNNNNALVLDFEDFNTYSYNNNNKVTSITTNRKRNGVTNPWSKVEYKYTNAGKLENTLYLFYDTPTAQFKKSGEDRYNYASQLEVFTSYTYNNPTSTAQVLWTDSTFLDNDNDIIQIRSLSYVLNGNPRYSKADYYYTIDEDKDGFDVSVDCDDNNPLVYPNAQEICDGLDNNCDGKIDDGLQTFTYFIDNDGDGYGVLSKADYYYTIDEDKDGFGVSVDCNDNNPLVYPNAQEICDGLDNNCDGKIDDGLQTFTYFIDNDGDGYGVLANALTTCQSIMPSGYASNNQDCDDGSAAVNPASTEVCDNIDNNCNGTTDDGLQTFTYFIDNDGDGYGVLANALTTCQSIIPSGYASNNQDCDDGSAAINPLATEIANNGIDEDCDGNDLTSSAEDKQLLKIKIYPNPANSVLNIDNKGGENMTVIIKTIGGIQLISKQNPSIIDISMLHNGIYIVQCIFETKVDIYCERIIIQH